MRLSTFGDTSVRMGCNACAVMAVMIVAIAAALSGVACAEPRTEAANTPAIEVNIARPSTPMPTPMPTPTPTPAPTLVPTMPPPLVAFDSAALPVVEIGGEVFDVEVVFTLEDRSRGLSGRDTLADGAGMLFVFESGETSSFWMRGMRFPLDFVWIGDECTVVDIDADVPLAVGVSSPPLYDSDFPARYNLEIAAGKSAALGIEVGDAVSFSGFYGRGVVC